MILRRVIAHFKKQEWTAIALDFLIVVIGVFIGIQVSNWNAGRAAEARRSEVIAALVTDLKDAVYVQEQIQIRAIDTGLAAWEAAFERGEHPAPFYYRVEGSDTAPDTWAVLQQMDIAGLFDPVSLFDLNFYYSELEGVGRKYVRYATFVETDILPFENGDPMYFYTEDGAALAPRFQASMDRLRDYRGETQRLSKWATCLTQRLESDARPTQGCVRADPSIRGEPLYAKPSVAGSGE